MWMLTEERKNELLKQRENKLAELEALRRKTPAELWRDDLDVFSEKLEVVEAKERADQAMPGGDSKAKDTKRAPVI